MQLNARLKNENSFKCDDNNTTNNDMKMLMHLKMHWKFDDEKKC